MWVHYIFYVGLYTILLRYVYYTYPLYIVGKLWSYGHTKKAGKCRKIWIFVAVALQFVRAPQFGKVLCNVYRSESVDLPLNSLTKATEGGTIVILVQPWRIRFRGIQAARSHSSPRLGPPGCSQIWLVSASGTHQLEVISIKALR